MTIFRRLGAREQWTLVGAPGHSLTRSGRSAVKLEQLMREDLRKLVRELPVSQLRTLERPASLRLEHIRIEFELDGAEGRRKRSGRWPMIVEQRLAGDGRLFCVAYHPDRQRDWFHAADELELGAQAQRFFRTRLAELDADDLEDMFSTGREKLHTIQITATPKPPKIERGIRGVARQPKRDPVLSTLARDETERIEALPAERLGVSREPHRAELSGLLCGVRKRSALVVGEPGSGRSTLIEQTIHDLLLADDYPAHRNLDRVHHVMRLSARQLIAGMSVAGEWEQRCFDLLAECKQRRVVLWIADLPVFGRTGRSRDSARSLSDVFAGPIARGELTVVAELSAPELTRLEEDAPGFTELFARVNLPPCTPEETARMLLRRARAVEAQQPLHFTPFALFDVLELASTLVTRRALPGSALDWLTRFAHAAPEPSADQPPREIGSGEVLAFVAAHTGLRRSLIDATQPLDFDAVQTALAARVLGQPEAVARTAEVVLNIKAGMTDPRRPYGVLFFTGPTGTGKTELAKALAEYLYGSETRLLRLDMGEYSGPDAGPRLIGETDGDDGVLTGALHQQPFSVVLFDEIEKTHASVLPLLLQVFDEGRLTDAAGRTASFRNAVLIMTSNLGARPRPVPGFEQGVLPSRQDSIRAVRDFFAPEFVNRIDQLIVFEPLAPEHARRIVVRELGRMCARPGLRDRNAIVVCDELAIDRVAQEAWQAADGARSLRRFLEDRVASLLSFTIARTPNAALRLVHLRASKQGFELDEHRLLEAAPLAARFALEPLLSQTRRQLLESVRGALQTLDAIAHSPDLAALAEHMREALGAHLRAERTPDGELYSLQWLRSELERLREQLAEQLRDPRQDALLDAERDADFVVQRGVDGPDSTEPVRVRMLHAPALERRALLSALTRVAFLRRALVRARRAGEHAVELVLLSVPAHPRERDGLLQWLSAALARAHGELDAFVVVYSELAGGGFRVIVPRFDLEFVLEDLASAPEVLRPYLTGLLVGEDAQQLFDLRAQRREYVREWSPDSARRRRRARRDDGDGLPVALREVADELVASARRGKLARVVGEFPALGTITEAAAGLPPSLLLIGPSGVGKSSWVRALAHRLSARSDADGARALWSTSAQRILSGLPYLGQWQARCLQLVNELEHSGDVLYVDRLLGIVTPQYEGTSIADFFDSALAERSVCLIAEASERELLLAERQRASFIAHFEIVRLREPDASDAVELLRAYAEPLSGPRLHMSSYQRLLSHLEVFHRDAALPGKGIRFLQWLAAIRAGRTDQVLYPRDVSRLYAQWTGLPERLLADDQPMAPETCAAELAARVVGQHDACAAGGRVLARLKAAMTDPDRPCATLLFVGPTGVGKTELAKQLAALAFGDERRLLRFDMSEYMLPDSSMRLLDVDAGARSLASRVREQPRALVLLDEIEKAHPRVLDLLLAVLDEGRLTDRQGREVDLRGTILVMTSNLGVRDRPTAGFGGADAETSLSAVRAHFRPELWNRIDQIVPFRTLRADDMQQIVRLELRKLRERPGFIQRNVTLRASDAAIETLARLGHDPRYGARPLKRMLEERIVAPIAARLAADPRLRDVRVHLLANGEPPPRDELTLTVDEAFDR